MLTRLEVDGFKNLLDFSVDFGPFTCIAGPNGVGKSNIFDAIQFLSLLADNPILDAALSIRDSDPETADLRNLFWTDGERYRKDFRMAAEMIVEPEVVDDFGRIAEASSTFLRYEVHIGYRAPSAREPLGRLVLRSEELQYITQGDAWNHLRFPHSAKAFRQPIVRNSRRTPKGYISTKKEDGQNVIHVHGEGHPGPANKAPAETAPRTIVATSNSDATPTILAARREMQGWRILALEPTAMRRPDRFHSPRVISPNGAHLPATLYRLAQEAGEDSEPEQVYARVANRLSDLVGVREIDVDVDEARQLLTLQAREDSEVRLPARSLSDGTLRFLTLCILAEDPTARGLLCLEEPENGIHPANMPAMVELLQDLAVDPNETPDDLNPLRQVIVATHSPVFVQLQKKDDLLLADEARIRTPDGPSAMTLRCRALRGTWRAEAGVETVGLASSLELRPERARPGRVDGRSPCRGPRGASAGRQGARTSSKVFAMSSNSSLFGGCSSGSSSSSRRSLQYAPSR